MIIEQGIGTLGDKKFQQLETDYVDIEWYQTHKKIDRRISRGGMEIGIRMNHEMSHRGWHQGDILYADEEKAVAVNILPASCISVKVTEPEQIVKLCYEVGNRHAPFFYGETKQEFLTPYEKPMLAMLEKIGLTPEVVQKRLEPGKRISSAHGSGHSHDGHAHGHSH